MIAPFQMAVLSKHIIKKNALWGMPCEKRCFFWDREFILIAFGSDKDINLLFV